LQPEKTFVMQTETNHEVLKRIVDGLMPVAVKTGSDLNGEMIASLLSKCFQALNPEDASKLMLLIDQALVSQYPNVAVTEVRPAVLDCDVVRFQNNKEKWVALVGLLDGYPYEIFTGLQDDDEGIILPKTVTHGKIIKQVSPDGTKRYDFQFENKRGYKTTVEGLSEKFNPEYWNYAKLISGVLRYRMPLEHVVRLVGSLSLKDESINTWKTGVERALKKYIPGIHDEEDTDLSEGAATKTVEP